MAEFRNIHTRIWKDEWFCNLELDEKLLFIYLFGNERASVSGIYELPIKFMAFEVGLEKENVLSILDKFRKAGKVFYGDGVVWVTNLRKYNETSSEKVQVRLSKDVEAIPDCEVLKMYCSYYKIPYPYHIHTLSGVHSRDGNGDGNRDSNGNSNRDGEEPAPPIPDPDPDPDPFEILRAAIESRGILPSSENDVNAIIDLVNCGITKEDILAGIDWKAGNNNGKAIRYVSQVVGPAKTEMAKRLQDGNGNPRKKDTFTPSESY